MDKFGIFKLLNSFFDFYQNAKQPLEKNPPENTSIENTPLSFKEEKPKNDENGKNSSENKAKPLLLQMLNTMNTHDKFVERVINKNKK